jgi:uncharacterized protein with HEPN domain
MRPDSEKLLWDIVDAGLFILTVTQGADETRYLGDRLFRQGIERNFEIIGEALNALAKEDLPMAEQIGTYRQVINLRHRLVHGYRDIDDQRMWAYIQDLLPPFVREVESLLEPDSTFKTDQDD